jgi:hypothetical protein
MTIKIAPVQVKKDAQDLLGAKNHQWIYGDRYRLVVNYISLSKKPYRIINKIITKDAHKKMVTFLGILNPDGTGECIIADQPSHDVQCIYSDLDVEHDGMNNKFEVMVIHDKHLAHGLEVVKHRFSPPLEVQIGNSWHVNMEYQDKRKIILDYLNGDF